MKPYPIAFGVVCAVSVFLFGITFALLKLFEIPEPQTVAVAVAGLPTAAFPQLKEYLEREEGRKRIAGGKQTPVYNFGTFQIAWPLMVIYGTAALWGALQVGSFGVLIFLPIAQLESSQANLATLMSMNNLVLCVGAYFVGRWVGTRCSRRGVITIFLIAPLAAISLVAADVLLFAPEEVYTGVLKRDRFGVRQNLELIAFLASISLVPSLVGYWRGRKQRLSKYLNYLLRVIPAGTRDTVVELAFDEAQKVASSASCRVKAENFGQNGLIPLAR